jgi:hypothetical protein
MSFVPARFLIRMAHRCRFVKKMPMKTGEAVVDLPENCRIDNQAALDGKTNFADVRLGWNDKGIGLQVVVAGKDQPVGGDAAKPKFSDGVTFWLDTRGDRTSHRASRSCHQFFLLPTGGGRDKDEPILIQTKINRALADAPIVNGGQIPFRSIITKSGYRIEAFFPAGALNGYDPEEHPRLGFYYCVRDSEFGEQTLSVGNEFPYSDDPSLWAVLDLVKD